MRKTVATVTAAAVLLVGGASTAWAEDGSRPDAPSGAAARSVRHPRAARGVLKVAAEAIGISPRDLASELRDGKTIADVAQNDGVDPQTVVDAIVAAATTKIDDAVEAGKLDPERAAELKDQLPDRITKLVNDPPRPRTGREALRQRLVAGLELAADTIGIERSELVSELRDGKTIADVAQDNGVDPQTVVDAIVAAATTKIDDAVEAGKLDPERAAELKDQLPDRITKLVNDPPRRGGGQAEPEA